VCAVTEAHCCLGNGVASTPLTAVVRNQYFIHSATSTRIEWECYLPVSVLETDSLINNNLISIKYNLFSNIRTKTKLLLPRNGSFMKIRPLF
jgi:hypothetical protein